MTRKTTKFAPVVGLALAIAGAMAQADDHSTTTPDSGNVAKPPATARATRSSDLLLLDDGRSGKGGLIATTGIRGFSKPPSAQSHALIMTIGDYPAPIPKLTGVPFDAAIATEIAQRMGVPLENIQVLKDGALTLDGIRAALDALDSSLSGNDQVFIYYSGHGGRQLVQEPQGEHCAESLITADGQGFTDTEMAQRLKAISEKSQKTVVFLDACFSGGVTTRSINATAPRFTAKSWSPPDISCKPSNMITRSIVLRKGPGSGDANYVNIAAASDSEVALDQPGQGSLATMAWLTCLQGAAKDKRGSGGLSADEIRACAQTQIDTRLKDVTDYLPPHVTLHGNADMVLTYAAKSNAAATDTTPQSAPTAVAPSARAALDDIYNNRDDRRITTLTAEKAALAIGHDTFKFTLRSREGGYAYLLLVGSDGKTFDLLFPNQLDKDNLMAAGDTLELPRTSWQLSADGPPGQDTLLAIVSDSPRDFTAAGLQASGPFSSVGAASGQALQMVSAGAGQPQALDCKVPAKDASTRNLSVQKRCSSSYAAALLTVTESAP